MRSILDSLRRRVPATGARSSAPWTPCRGRPGARLPAAIALAALAAASVACQPPGTAEPEAVTPDAPSIAIAGPCAEASRIQVPTTAEGDAWQPVRVDPAAECFALNATRSDTAGVPVDAGFVLSSAVALHGEDLAALLRVEPPLGFSVTESEARGAPRAPGSAREAEQLGHAYALRPLEPLEPGTVYRFTLHRSPEGEALSRWAFETQAPLTIVRTLPEDEATGVALNTGIEVTFSHDDVTGAEDAFAVSPDTPGTFEWFGRTLVFVPESLQPETLYSVRIAPGIRVDGSDLALGEPFAFRFETGTQQRTGEAPPTGPALRFSRAVWEQPTGDAPVMSLFSTGAAEDGLMTVSVAAYRYGSVDAFLADLEAYAAIPTWAWSTRAAHRASTEALEPAATFDAELQVLGDDGELLLAFPDALAEGFYLVEAEVAGGPVQAWLQVTDVGTYVAVADERLLVWVNDVGSGRPIAGAEISADGATFETDGEGIAFVEAPEDLATVERHRDGASWMVARGDLVVVAPDGRTAVVPVSDVFRGARQPGYRDWRGGATNDLYWRYLYSDRQLYRLSDTVRFWGVARRRGGEPAVTSATVELRGGPFAGLDGGEPVVARVTVPVGPSGTYSGTLAFEGASPGFYTLRTVVGQDELTRSGVELRDFVTPAYRITAEAARRAVFAGETITVSVAASFFEGSPVPGLELRVEGDTSDTLVTDASGGAELTYVASRAETPYGHSWSQVAVRPARPEEGQMSGGASVVVVPAAVALEVRGEAVADGAQVSGRVRAVDLARVNEGRTADPTDFMADGVAEQAVSVEVVELVQRAIEVGTTYDFTSKRAIPTYRYETEEQPVDTFETTSSAAGEFSVDFPAREGAGYRVIARTTDAAGRVASREVYVGPAYPYGPSGQVLLDALTTGPYAVGDAVELQLGAGGETLPEGDAYLFLRAKNGILDYALQASPTYAFTFAEEHIPNVHVLAVRFTGGTYQEAQWGYSVPFDSATRALQIDLATDRERYAPGEDVTLDVRVRDADDRPTAATVLLSAVDAAIEQLQGGGIGDAFRTSLYANVGSGVLRTYASHQYPLGAPGAEGGGGGDGRSDFRDVVLFQEVVTDAEGRASVTFRVPDNLTSWAVTALGLSDDLRAGTGLGQVPVGIPLFADVTMNDSYLVTDRPVIRLRAFGEGLDAGAPVSFEVASETLFEQPIQLEATAFEPVSVPLPPLKEGVHEIRVAVTSGDLLDALVRPLTVLPSRLSAARTATVELETGQVYEPDADGLGAVDLVVSDANRGRYYGDLMRLAWTHGDRLDQALARDAAGGLLTTYFTTTQAAASGVRPEVYQTQDGGAALLPFGDDDLTLSAQVAAAAPSALGRQGLVQFFGSVVDDPEATRERRVEALLGLASLGVPVLTEVSAALSTSDLTPRELLGLGLAALALGDEPAADRAYRDVLTEYGEQRGSRIRLRVGDDRDEALEAGLLAARLGAGLGESTAVALYEHVAADRPETSVLALLEVGYLQQVLPRLAATPVTVAFQRFGARQEETLQEGQTLTMRMPSAELSELDLTVVDGTARVALATLEPIDAARRVFDPEVTVARTYRVAGPAAAGESGPEAVGATFQNGDLIRVELRYALGEQAAPGCYQLSDLLPSGLRAVSGAFDASAYYEGVQDPSLVYPYDVRGQRVSFCGYRDGDQDPLSYLARVVTAGQYTAEPALLQSMLTPESGAFSEATTVSIR